VLVPTTWGAGGSSVAVSSHAAIFVATKAAALDAFVLSAGSFVALSFFGGMISSSDNYDGRQCCSRVEAFEHWLLPK
jgi:hypothetical protein